MIRYSDELHFSSTHFCLKVTFSAELRSCEDWFTVVSARKSALQLKDDILYSVILRFLSMLCS